MGMSVGSLFCGIGGIDLGLERAGWKVRWQVEIDAFATRVLEHHWPDVPRHRDVRGVGAHNLEPVDLIAGGFPCQDISVAGKGAGLDGERSGLWFEFLRVVQELRPRWVLVENVPALRTRGADTVLDGLAAAGYACWPLVVGARHVGAPHRRDRVWIVARLDDAAGAGRGAARRAVDARAGGAGALDEPAGAGEGLADGERARLEGHGTDTGRAEVPEPRHDGSSRRRHRWPARPGEQQHEWEEPRVVDAQRRGWNGLPEWLKPGHVATDTRGSSIGPEPRTSRPEKTAKTDWCSPESPLGGPAHGLLGRLAGRHRRASLKALGNSVVPQVVELIGRAILAAEKRGE